MAAVAQAASANNKSPAEAAEIAKANAQNITLNQLPPQTGHQIRQQQMQRQAQQQSQHLHRAPSVRPEPRKIQPVPLDSVKSLLQSEIAAAKDPKNAASKDNDSFTSSKLLEKLANGENDSLMQQLLLMEYLEDSETSTSDSFEDKSSDGEDVKSMDFKASFACERIKFLLKQIETAYESMEDMLPKVQQPSVSENHSTDASDAMMNASFGSDDYDLDPDLEALTMIPDFLPPCTSKGGDNTLEFFRACSGKTLGGDQNGSGDVTPSLSASATGTMDSLKEDGDGASESGATVSTDASAATSASTLFGGMFGAKRPSLRARDGRPGLLASISRRVRKGRMMDEPNEDDSAYQPSGMDHKCEPGEYFVIIEREMLGLTVENVLERTVVRTVLEAGPAKKAGAKVGSLIVKVGNIETKNLTHFETIDELRQSQRPLVLILRQIPEAALKAAREEMGRLIRGLGFGKIIDGEGGPSFPGIGNANPSLPRSPGGPSYQPRELIQNIGTYSGIIRKRWIEAVNLTPRSKKCEPILRVGEKLLWIMTLFVIGLEREAERLFALAKDSPAPASFALSPRSTFSGNSQYGHSGQDYADAAKSASKVLFDFVKNRMDPSCLTPPTPPPPPSFGGRGRGPMGGRGGRGGRGRGGRGMNAPNPPPVLSSDKLLQQIGDVLQRMRSFLADPASPPAAMIRGELIACLCDILDADTEMKLSEDNNMSGAQGGEGAGPIADLGAAGSLLKLIILNSAVTRGLEFERLSKGSGETKDDDSMQRIHAGNRFLAVVHRLAASRSTSARITACSLGPVLWSRLDFPHQLQVG
jgi:hypothetical protein